MTQTTNYLTSTQHRTPTPTPAWTSPSTATASRDQAKGSLGWPSERLSFKIREEGVYIQATAHPSSSFYYLDHHWFLAYSPSALWSFSSWIHVCSSNQVASCSHLSLLLANHLLSCVLPLYSLLSIELQLLFQLEPLLQLLQLSEIKLKAPYLTLIDTWLQNGGRGGYIYMLQLTLLAPSTARIIIGFLFAPL